jgi:hypothetical protein
MEKHSITTTTKILMVGTAIFFDVVQLLVNFIPGIGQVLAVLVNIFAQMTFWLWFTMKGVKYNSGKRLGAFLGGFLLELIPILDALPGITIEVVAILGTLEAEKILGNVPGGNMVASVATKTPVSK